MNRNILITGASSGIGFEAVLLLIKQGHRIIAPCRNESRVEDTLLKLKRSNISDVELNKQVLLPVLDLASLKDIRNFADDLVEKEIPLDTLILNAGLQYTGSKVPRFSLDGIELTFAVNHLAHQYLTERLTPLLIRDNDLKIIITSSEVHNPKAPGGKIGQKASLGDLSGLKSGNDFNMLDGNPIFSADKAYKDSKVCNILFARELHKRLSEKCNNYSVIAWAPGLVIPKTNQGFFRYSRQYNEIGQKIFAFFARDIFGITESVENAGFILSELACNLKFQYSEFTYLSNKIIKPRKKLFEISEISREASDDQLAKDLWEKSNELFIN